MSETDLVNHPPHYKVFPNREAIGLIEHELTLTEYIGYLKGNALKYRLRAGKKYDTVEDIEKAMWYERELERVFRENYKGSNLDVTV